MGLACMFQFMSCATTDLGKEEEEKLTMKSQTNTNSKTEEAEMILVLTQEPSLPVGYGMTYQCTLKAVKKGKLEMETFTMTVMASDMDVQQWLSEHSASTEIEMGFKKAKEDVIYSIIPITGFVDANKTAWEVVFYR